ncbi:WecB/TagA/CpsF family glycosyltransferase [Actinopolymorpha sp. B11F2]|uniref:WecB/TagA/CpsF family glycosyltransferase n=1 Tax=Actinopolymorpha sp. B11F2 TaxID=3160862 RepID=UPI0032E45BA5
MTAPRRADADDDGIATDAPSSRRTHICGVPVDALTMEESVNAACALIRTGQPHQHVAINAAKVIAARHDPHLRQVLESCAIANADGQSVVWASRLLGSRVPERVTGIDFMLRMWEVAAERGFRVYLLGSKPETVRRTADVARSQGVDIVGARNGFWTPEGEASVVAEVAAARPDLLFVGLPTPRKEEFLHRHLGELRAGLAVGVGGSFDVVAGVVSRAPLWMQKSGLEWLHRMAQEPRRLLGRYVLGNVEFVFLVAREAVTSRRPPTE